MLVHKYFHFFDLLV